MHVAVSEEMKKIKIKTTEKSVRKFLFKQKSLVLFSTSELKNIE